MGLSELFSWEDLSPGDAKFGPMEGKDKYEPGSGSAPPRRRSERLGKKPVRSFDSGTGFDVGFGFGDDDDESEKEKSEEKVKGRNKKRSLKRKNVDVVSGGDVAVDADVSVAKELSTKRPTFKIIVVGDSGVGKTCLTYRFCSGKFPSR